jgi:hypothetical protein
MSWPQQRRTWSGGLRVHGLTISISDPHFSQCKRCPVAYWGCRLDLGDGLVNMDRSFRKVRDLGIAPRRRKLCKLRALGEVQDYRSRSAAKNATVVRTAGRR